LYYANYEIRSLLANESDYCLKTMYTIDKTVELLSIPSKEKFILFEIKPCKINL
jgi:hypothetical protein